MARMAAISLMTGILLTSSIVPTYGMSRIEEEKKPWWRNDTLVRDSYRHWLEDQGITVELVSTTDMLSKRSGGLRNTPATASRLHTELAITLDFERLGYWSGAMFHVRGQDGRGSGLSERYVGDMQTLSNIDAHGFTQVSEYWLEQDLLDERLRFKVGKQDSNADFVTLESGGDFINSSFGLIPTVPAPTFPYAALGLAAFLKMSDRLGVGAGLYDGAPDGCTTGVSTAFDGVGGTFSVLELSMGPFLVERHRSGTYRTGFWYHSEDIQEITDESPGKLGGNYGAYLTIDQIVFEEYGDDEQGLRLFAQLGVSPEDRNEIARYLGAGISYAGAIRGRDEDVIGLGVAHALPGDNAGELDHSTHETAIELFYKARVLAWLSVQPDIQYILDPGCHGEDALVGGFRLEIVF